ncbi:MAG: hypothetical protein V3S68_07300 [Dehalococcoidia bacterium]
MYWLENCPRCSGDLYGNSDIYGSFVYCLQCGHYLTEAEEANIVSGSTQVTARANKSVGRPKKAKQASRRSKPLPSGTAAFPPVVHIKIPSTTAA